MKKLDMLFFLGIFAVVYGFLLIFGWVIFKEALNLYGILLLLPGIFLVVTRPKPPLRFFFGRFNPDTDKEPDVQCWCGRIMKSGNRCGHGEGEDQDSQKE